MKYSININTKIIKETYNDILNLYDFFEDVFQNSSIRDLPHDIESSVKIGNLNADNLKKEEFIKDAFGFSDINFDRIYLHVHDKLHIQTSFMYKSINVSSDDKILVAEFVKIIEDKLNLQKGYVPNNAKENLIVNANPTDIKPDNSTSSIINENKKSWFEKYWFPLILTLISVVGAIVAAFIAIK